MAKKKRQKPAAATRRGCRRYLRYFAFGIVALLFYQVGMNATSRSNVPQATQVPTERVVAVAQVVTVETPEVNSEVLFEVESSEATLIVTDIEFLTELDGSEPGNGLLAVLRGSFTVPDRRCIVARDIRLILDGTEYAPDRGWMHAVRESLDIDADYPGPIGGQCVEDNAATVIVFDIPAEAETVSLRMYETTVTIETWNGSGAVAQAATATSPRLVTNTPKPTTAAVATSTSRPTVTATPQTFYVVGTANVRACPRTTCEIVSRLAGGDIVQVTGGEAGETVSGSDRWYRVLIGGKTAYVHTSLVSASKPEQSAPVVATSGNVSVPPTAQSGGGGATCPSLSATCSQLTCAQAYACLAAGNGSLDRDKDGVPCESICPGG